MTTQDPGLRTRDSSTCDAGRHLDLAARLALRGMGDVEPNPMVGAVIVRDGRVIGLGHHGRFGGLHAEREALADCRRRSQDPRGATMYVTLEPCCHQGKQPPCTDALIEAGIARVIAARRDPNPVSGDGAAILAGSRIRCEFTDASPLAAAISEPFVRGFTHGLPWVIAKWAQTGDGRLVTGPGEPRWISGEVSRRRVHKLRARVDAVLTGMGTVLADDPLLTARGVRRHRVASRVVIDPRLELPLGSALVRTAREVPVVVVCDEQAGNDEPRRRGALESAGVRVVGAAGVGRRLRLSAVLTRLRADLGVSTVLLECGSRLLAQMFDEGLVDVAMVHVAGAATRPDAAPASAERAVPGLGDPAAFSLCRARRRGDDVELIYRRLIASRT